MMALSQRGVAIGSWKDTVKSIVTTITIDAPVDRVWHHLLDFESHPEWDPFFASISGEARVGERLHTVIRKHHGVENDAPGMSFRPEVLVAEPGVELRWVGKLAVRGLVDGTHYFRLSESNGTTTLEHGEEFRGLLVPFLGRTLRQTEEGFVAFNQALKERAEA